MKQASGYCPVCQAPSYATRPGVNHVLHLLLTLLTMGFWLIVWIFLTIMDSFNPFICNRCGSPVRVTPPYASMFGVLLVVVLIVVVVRQAIPPAEANPKPQFANRDIQNEQQEENQKPPVNETNKDDEKKREEERIAAKREADARAARLEEEARQEAKRLEIAKAEKIEKERREKEEREMQKKMALEKEIAEKEAIEVAKRKAKMEAEKKIEEDKANELLKAAKRWYAEGTTSAKEIAIRRLEELLKRFPDSEAAKEGRRMLENIKKKK